jgi:cardiolipin-specific phospholipase
MHHLPRLQVPTYFLYGDDDWMDHRHAEKAVEKMGQDASSRIHIVPKSGHHLYLDNPTEFNATLSRLINEK